MDKHITLQVADTRFAVRCSVPSFMKWLAERYQGFISQGEPHLWLNLSLDNFPQGRRPGELLSITAVGNHGEHIALKISVACKDLADFFWLTLHLCLRCAVVAKQPPDLLLHSAGIVRGGMTYLFPGPSGSGKSTICELLANDSIYTVLHDDVVALSQRGERFYAWSTFPKEEVPAKYSSGAPLRAIFFPMHDQTNYATRLSGRKAAGLLALNLIPPQVVKNGGLGVAPVESLGLALTLAECIPCYELHFRPEYGFWECIPQFFENEYAKS
jgi:hypothetical protein